MPYDGSSKAFTIGLKPIDAADWIDVDEQLPRYLDEKAVLAATRFGDIFAAEAGTEAAQGELRDLLVAYLLERFPQIYQRDGNIITIVPASRRIDLTAQPALWTAASLVQDDLVILRAGDNGWRVAAGAICFPSSWRLADKVGRPMHEVHGPVPGFGAGSRLNEIIGRMFDNMKPGVVGMRWNWSLFGDNRLFHPDAHPDMERFGAKGEAAHLRVERQTLRKLPVSGDIVFAIRIYVEPLAALARHPDGRTIAGAIGEQIAAMSDEQAAYKGLYRDRALLLERLAALAAG
jgi:hypothetical protein